MTKSQSAKITSTLAKSDNGNVQITFDIPFELVNQAKTLALAELAKDKEIPGFRKGMAPPEQVEKHISNETLVEKALQKLLPKALAEAINQYRLKPAIYPKFELVKSKDNEPWQIRATTCELPEFTLGDYKQIITEASKVKTIWIPGKDKDEKTKDKSKEEKEQEVIKLLLETVKIDIPQLLIDEEVNNRLSSLLERTERLGLNLENYLASVGKTPEKLRQEYEVQAKNTIALDLILEKIATEEKIEVAETQIDEVIKAASADTSLPDKLNTSEQRRLIASVLRRRNTLEKLITLL